MEHCQWSIKHKLWCTELNCHNSEVLKSYILVIGDIITVTHNPTPVAFKNCASFIKFIIKIDKTTINDPEDLDLVMFLF